MKTVASQSRRGSWPLALACALVVTSPLFAIDYYWFNSAGGSWNSSANWSPTGVPGAGDRAFIHGSAAMTVSISASTTVGYVEVAGSGDGPVQLRVASGLTLTVNEALVVGSGGALSVENGNVAGAGNIDVYGALTWQQGVLSGTGTLTTHGTATLLGMSSANIKTLSGRHWINSGLVTFAPTSPAAILRLSNNALITNTASGEWNMATDGELALGPGGGGTFNNQGLLIKTGGGGSSIVWVPVANAGGTIRAASGALSLRGGGQSVGGTLEGNGGVLEFNGGTHVLDAATHLDGITEIRQSAGDVHFSGEFEYYGNLCLSGGTFHYDATDHPLSLMRLDLNGGTLAGSGAVEVWDSFTWNAGNLAGAGIFKNEGVAVIGDGAMGQSKALDGRQWHNYGTVYHQTSNADTALLIDNGGLLINKPEALFKFESAGGLAAGTGSGQFINHGVVRRGPGSSVVSIPLLNHATLEIDTGALELGGGFDNQGTVHLMADGVLAVVATPFVNHSAGIIRGQGGVQGSAPLINAGLLIAGDPFGELSFGVPVTCGATSELTAYGELYPIWAAASTTGPQPAEAGAETFSGLFRFDAGAVLGGHFRFVMENNYGLEPGVIFPVAAGSEITGRFASIQLPELYSAFGWDLRYTATSIDLLVTDTAQPAVELVAGEPYIGSFEAGNWRSKFVVNYDGELASLRFNFAATGRNIKIYVGFGWEPDVYSYSHMFVGGSFVLPIDYTGQVHVLVVGTDEPAAGTFSFDWQVVPPAPVVRVRDGVAATESLAVQPTQYFGHSYFDSVAVAVDGNLYYPGNDSLVKRWDVATMTPGGFLTTRGHPVERLAAARNALRLVAVDRQGRVMAWDLATSQRLFDSAPVAEYFYDHRLAISGNGQRIALRRDAYSWYGVVQVLDGTSGAPIGEVQTGQGYIQAVALSDDGSRLVVAGGTQLQVWDTESLQQTAQAEIGTYAIYPVISPDGNRLAVTDNGTQVRVYDLATLELVWSQSYAGYIVGLEFSADGEHFAMALNNATIQIGEAASGSIVHQFTAGSEEFIGGLAIMRMTGAPEQLVSWDYYTGVAANTFDGQQLSFSTPSGLHYNTFGASLSPDGQTLVSRDQASYFLEWDVATGIGRQPDVALDWPWLEFVRHSADGSRLVVFDAMTILVLDVQTYDTLLSIESPDYSPADAHFSPDGSELLVAYYGGTVRRHSTTTGAKLHEYPLVDRYGYDAVVVTPAPDYTWFAVGLSDGVVSIVDIASGQVQHSFVGYNTWGRRPLAISPDNTVLAFGSGYSNYGGVTSYLADAGLAEPQEGYRSDAAEISLVTVADGQIRRILQLPDDTMSIRNLAWSPDGSRLALATNRGLLTIGTGDARMLQRFAGFTEFGSVEFARDGRSLMGVSQSGSALLYPAATPPQLQTAIDFVAWQEGQDPLAIAPGLTVQQVDDRPLTMARVLIGSGFQPGDVLTADAAAGLTVAWHPQLGVLDIVGDASAEEYQQVLRSVRFEHVTNFPLERERRVIFWIRDAWVDSDRVAIPLAITSVNDAPTIDPVAPIVVPANSGLVEVPITGLSSGETPFIGDPVLVATESLIHDAEYLAHYDNLVYVVTNGAVSIYEMSGQQGPTYRGEFVASEDSYAYRMVVAGTLAAVAEYSLYPYVAVYDLTDPLNPHPTGYTLPGVGYLDHIVAAGDHVIVVSNYDLLVFSLDGQEGPELVWSTSSVNWITAVTAFGDRLYVADYEAIRVYDLSNSLEPEPIHSYAPDFTPQQLAADAYALYVGFSDYNASNQISVLERGFDGSLHEVRRLRENTPVYNLAVAHGRLVYTTNYGQTLRVFDVVNPQTLLARALIPVDGYVANLSLGEKYLFYSDYSPALSVVDLMPRVEQLFTLDYEVLTPELVESVELVYEPGAVTAALWVQPVAGAAGTIQIVVRVLDAGGTANGGTNLTVVQVAIEIEPQWIAPDAVSAIASYGWFDDRIRVEWRPNELATGYIVDRQLVAAESAEWLRLDNNWQGNVLIDANVEPGVEYAYRVAAWNHDVVGPFGEIAIGFANAGPEYLYYQVDEPGALSTVGALWRAHIVDASVVYEEPLMPRDGVSRRNPVLSHDGAMLAYVRNGFEVAFSLGVYHEVVLHALAGHQTVRDIQWLGGGLVAVLVEDQSPDDGTTTWYVDVFNLNGHHLDRPVVESRQITAIAGSMNGRLLAVATVDQAAGEETVAVSIYDYWSNDQVPLVQWAVDSGCSLVNSMAFDAQVSILLLQVGDSDCLDASVIMVGLPVIGEAPDPQTVYQGPLGRLSLARDDSALLTALPNALGGEDVWVVSLLDDSLTPVPVSWPVDGRIRSHFSQGYAPQRNPVVVYVSIDPAATGTVHPTVLMPLGEEPSLIDGPSVESFVLPANEIARLHATPAAAFRFIGWSGDVPSSDFLANPLVFEAARGYAFAANFALIDDLTLLADVELGEGSVVVDPLQETYTYGTEVSLTAEPATGYRFIGWTGDVASEQGQANPLFITMKGHRQVFAQFALIDDLTLLAGVELGEGSVMVDPLQSAYTYGTEVSLTAEPATGYRFVGWTGDVPAEQGQANAHHHNDWPQPGVRAVCADRRPDFAGGRRTGRGQCGRRSATGNVHLWHRGFADRRTGHWLITMWPQPGARSLR
jgi:WD40 repeat protein